MPRLYCWMAAIAAAGCFASPALAFHRFARNQDTVVVDQPAPATPSVNGETVNCGTGCHLGILGGHRICDEVGSAVRCVHQWLGTAPAPKPPPPPKPLIINPYLRSPRDYFMMGDP